jgi:hypothetical protein
VLPERYRATRGRRKIPPPGYSGRSACGPLSEHFQVWADKSLSLKHEYFLFGDYENRAPPEEMATAFASAHWRTAEPRN